MKKNLSLARTKLVSRGKSKDNILSPLTYVMVIDPGLIITLSGRQAISMTIESLLRQTVLLCDLLIVTDKDTIGPLRGLIDYLVRSHKAELDNSFEDAQKKSLNVNGSILSRRLNKCKIHLYESLANGIAGSISEVLGGVKTEWVAIIRSGMRIAPHATYELISVGVKNPFAALIYADHDLIDQYGLRTEPTFKTIFSLDLLFSKNYIGNFVAIKKIYLENYKPLFAKLTFELYIFGLILNVIQELVGQPAKPTRLRQLVNKIIHTPHVLHSDFKQNPFNGRIRLQESQLQLAMLTRHLSESYEEIACIQTKPFMYQVKWPLPKCLPLVSLIIPTKNGYKILKACVESILKKTTYKNYEIIIVDNQTTDPKTLNYLAVMTAKYSFIRVIKYDKPFNYSDINNQAVKKARGQILGFVNNDIEVLNKEWLTEMVSHAIRPDVGCVGAMHYYPDMRIQHAGVVVGMHGVADHAFKGIFKKPVHSGEQDYLFTVRNPDAVTAATLVMRKDLFEAIGGFDSTHLKIAFNDVDLCLKAVKRGYRCVWTPYAELIHYESESRKHDQSWEVTVTEMYEHRIMKKRWKTDQIVPRDILKSITFGML